LATGHLGQVSILGLCYQRRWNFLRIQAYELSYSGGGTFFFGHAQIRYVNHHDAGGKSSVSKEAASGATDSARSAPLVFASSPKVM